MAEPPEPKFALGPLAGVALAAAAFGISRGSRLAVALGAAAATLEFTWPAYQRLKRQSAVPHLIAYYPD